MALRAIKPGVYEVDAISRRIRVVVAGLLPRTANNALLHMFSANGDLFSYGAEHYRVRSSETSLLLADLSTWYLTETLTMPDLLEEYTRQRIDQILKSLSVEKRLEGLSAEKRLEGLSADEIIAALSPQKREALARQLKANGSPPSPP